MLLSDQQKYIISVLKQVKYIRLCQLYALTVQHYRKERFEISQHRMDVMLRQLRTGRRTIPNSACECNGAVFVLVRG